VGPIPCCCSFTPAHSRLHRSQPLYKPPPPPVTASLQASCRLQPTEVLAVITQE